MHYRKQKLRNQIAKNDDATNNKFQKRKKIDQ